MGIILSMTYIDGHGRQGTKSVELITSDPAQAVTDAGIIAGAYDGLIAGGIRKLRLTIPVAYTPTAPDPLSDRAQGLTFSAILDGGIGERGVLKVPAPFVDVVTAGDSVDLTDTRVTNVLDLYTGVIKLAAISDGQTVNLFTKGVLDKD